MALAIVELDAVESGRHVFRAQIGTNRYWSLVVGDGREPATEEGFAVMGEVTHRTRVAGPLPPQALGRTVIGVPSELFDREHRHVQLLSFSEASLTGRAMSDVVAVPPGGGSASDGLDPIAFGFAYSRPFDVVAFRRARPRVATAMWLEVLAGIARQLLPVVAPLLDNLLGGPPPAAPPAPPPPAATNGKPPAVVAPAPAQGAMTPANAKLLADLITSLFDDPKSPPATSNAKSRGFDLSPTAHLSQAQIAPALIAALPALMPLLQQVLSPETIKGVLQTADPNRLIATVTDGLHKLAGLGLEAQKQELAHLEKMNPGTATPDLIQLMESMGMSRELSARVSRRPVRARRPYRRVDGVELQFAEATLLELAGREQVCVLAGRSLAFPLTLETPRPIRSATLRLRVKDATTLRPVCARSWPVEANGSGRLAVEPSLTRESAERLVAGGEYLVEAELTWKGRGGVRLGASRTQLISVVGPVVFGGLEQSTEVIPLNDVEADRAFWHKAWQGTFSTELRKIVFNVRYHYTLDPAARRNAQMETVEETEPASARHEVGRLGSGLVLAPPALNQLLLRLGREPLAEAELLALASPEAVKRFSLAARTRVSLRGRPGDSAALWVYPEVKIQTVVLRSAADVNAAGHVLRFDERRVGLPVPVLAHVIGVVSQ